MRYFLLLALSLCFASGAVSAASPPLSTGDFRFDSEGFVVNIDKNGVELYLHYTGALRDTAENIGITVDDPSLKITFGKRCNIKPSPDTCKFVLNYTNLKLPSYGKKTITVLNESQEKIADYVIWVKPSKDEEELHWFAETPFLSHIIRYVNGPVIMQNGTHMTRTYGIHVQSWAGPKEFLQALKFELPAKSLCYIDRKLYHPDIVDISDFWFSLNHNLSLADGHSWLEDVTYPDDKSYNAFYRTGKNNLSTCATEGETACSRKWGSWTIGLMNLTGDTQVDKGERIKSGEIKYQNDRSWNSGDTIYYTGYWNERRMALFAIQGTTDGSDFDPRNISPSLQEAQTAPPCSKYTDQPAPSQETLVIRIKGPGTMVDERGVVYRSTLSAPTVDDGVLVELTAVPDEGHKFTGWSGAKCNNDSLYCAVNIDGYTDITANFE